MTRDQFQQYVLTFLDEAVDTPAGSLDEGDGPPPAVPTETSLDVWTDDAARRICQSCYAYPTRALFEFYDVATYAFALADHPAVRGDAPPGLTADDGSRLWTAREVIWGPRSADGLAGRALKYVDPTAMALSGLGQRATASGTPTYYTLDGGRASFAGMLYFDKRPAGVTPFEVVGYGVPPAITVSLTTDWASPVIQTAMAAYVCAKFCEKNNSDPNLGFRRQAFADAFDAQCRSIYSFLNDATRTLFFPTPPSPLYGVGRG